MFEHISIAILSLVSSVGAKMAKGKSQTDPRSWDAVQVPDWMRDYASSMGYRKMTAVQASCVPQFLEKGTDVVVEV